MNNSITGPTRDFNLYDFEFSKKSTNINICDLVEAGCEEIAIRLTHSFTCTLLDFTGAPDYLVLLFNSKDQLTEIKYAINNSAPHVISTRYKKIVLIKL